MQNIANVWGSILLQKVGPFDDVSFKIPLGISTIYGFNTSAHDPNAAGKSMLFSSIFDTMYENPVAAEKTDRLRVGTRGVHIDLQGKPLFLKRVGSKSSLKYNGVMVHGATNVKRKLEEILPWTWEDVVTYIHLDSQTPHPLVKGSNANRKAFLTSFFGLDKIDAEKKIIKAALDKVSGAADKHALLEEELAELKPRLPPKGMVEKLTERAGKMQAHLEQLQEGAAEADQSRRAALFREQAAPQIEHYQRACDEAGKEDLDSLIADFEKQLARNMDLLEQAGEFEDWQERQNRFNAWAQNLSPQTKAFIKSGNVEVNPQAIAAKLDKAKYRLDDLRDELATIAPACREKLVPVQQPKRPLGEARAALESAKHQLQHAQKFGSGSCPTCGQHVKVADKSKLTTTISMATACVNMHEKYEEYKDAAERQELARSKFTTLKAEITKIEAFVQANGKYRVIANELRDAPKRPGEFNGKRIIAKVVRGVIDELNARLNALKFLKRNEEIFEQAMSLGESAEFAKSNVEQVASLTRELTQIEAKLARAQALTEQYQGILEKQAPLKRYIGRAKALEELLAGYDDKAMKKLVVQALSSRLGQQIAKYASIVFPEFKFELKWDASQVEFLVHRHFKDRVDTTDIRRLSGAETKLFTVVLVMALMAFVPSEKRSSMIVLDEPAANMGPANIQRFQELLPMLNKMIPSVIIITPKSEERYGGREFTVCKIRGSTTVVEGHPSTIKLSTQRKKAGGLIVKARKKSK